MNVLLHVCPDAFLDRVARWTLFHLETKLPYEGGRLIDELSANSDPFLKMIGATLTIEKSFFDTAWQERAQTLQELGSENRTLAAAIASDSVRVTGSRTEALAIEGQRPDIRRNRGRPEH